jgi:PAS domain S-box-containing protein
VNDQIVLNSLQQITNWGILTTDAGLQVTGINAWFEANCGRPANEIVGRSLLEVFPEVVARSLDQRYRQVLTGSPAVLSQRLHGYLFAMPANVEGGAERPMQQSARIAPLIENGQVVGTLTLVEDVTERVDLETGLRAAAQQHAVIAELAQRVLAGGDRAALLNDVAVTIAGALKVPFCGIFEHQADQKALVLRAGTNWASGEFDRAGLPTSPPSLGAEILASAGPIVLDETTSPRFSPLPDLLARERIQCGINVAVRSGAGVFGAIGIYTDQLMNFQQDEIRFLEAAAHVLGIGIERLRLEDALRLRAEQLATADQRKNEFLAMLAHELRNPLAPIQNAIQLLRLKGSAEQELEWARDVIERQVRQMTRLINDLLDVSRISTGKVSLQMELVNLQSIVEVATEISRPVIDAHYHTYTVSLDPAPMWLQADSTRLAQALANILNNAAKYTPDGGRIALTAAREGEEVVIRVNDSGMGIPAAMLPSVFDLFTQVDRSMDRSEGGLGIGLTLVRNLVELHGGSVQALSAGSGLGSEFVLRLPAQAPPEVNLLQREQASNSATRPASRQILVVDDNVDCAKTLAKLLKTSGNSVAVAFSGAEAIQAISRHPPEVVFLDIGLPGMNGLEVARQLRGERALNSCFLIAVSGYGQMVDRDNSAAAGFDYHLVKPVTPESLTRLLNELPARRQNGG